MTTMFEWCSRIVATSLFIVIIHPHALVSQRGLNHGLGPSLGAHCFLPWAHRTWGEDKANVRQDGMPKDWPFMALMVVVVRANLPESLYPVLGLRGNPYQSHDGTQMGTPIWLILGSEWWILCFHLHRLEWQQWTHGPVGVKRVLKGAGPADRCLCLLCIGDSRFCLTTWSWPATSPTPNLWQFPDEASNHVQKLW